MDKSIVRVIRTPLFSTPEKQDEMEDELLCGMIVYVGEKGGEYTQVTTSYGTKGYVANDSLSAYMKRKDQRILWAASADLYAVPDWKKIPELTLYRGSWVDVIEEGENGWIKVNISGTDLTGFMRQSAVTPPFQITPLFFDAGSKMRGCSVFGRVTAEDRDEFRLHVTQTASLYLHTPYRWGGRSTDGIDASGLCSMAYLLNGVYICRDAAIKEGWPVTKLFNEEEWKTRPGICLEKLKPADLLYFDQHMAMYLGKGRAIHADPEAGEVRCFSMNKEDQDYRPDLWKKIRAGGTIFG